MHLGQGWQTLPELLTHAHSPENPIAGGFDPGQLCAVA